MKSTISILYFASFRERLDIEKEILNIDTMQTLADVIQKLSTRGKQWKEIFTQKNRLIMSINQEITQANSSIQAGDEIAFFPPITGG